MRLFLAQTSDADGTAFPVGSTGSRFNSDIFTFYVWGTFGSGTVKLQISPDDGTTWFDVPNTSVTAKTVMNVEIRATQVRANLASSSGASIYAQLI